MPSVDMQKLDMDMYLRRVLKSAVGTPGGIF